MVAEDSGSSPVLEDDMLLGAEGNTRISNTRISIFLGFYIVS